MNREWHMAEPWVCLFAVFVLGACGPQDSQDSGVVRSIGPSNAASVGMIMRNGLESPVVLDEVLLRCAPGADDELVLNSIRVTGAEVVGRVKEIRLWQVRISNPALDPTVLEASIATLKAQPGVEAAFPNEVLAAAAYYPDDGYSWDGATDDCQCSEAWANPDLINQTWAQQVIGLPEAWEHTTGSTDFIIGVVDDGIQQSHPELRGRVEQRYLSDNAISNDHGTFVTGIIAATGDNGKYTAGVNWHSRVYFYPWKNSLSGSFREEFCKDIARLWKQSPGWCEPDSHDAATTTATLQEDLVLAAIDRVRLINFSAGHLLPANVYPDEANTAADAADKQAWLAGQRDSWRLVMETLREAGVLLVVSAGNNSNGPVHIVDSVWSGGPQSLASEFPENIVVVAAVGDPDGSNQYFGQWADEWSLLGPYSSAGTDVDVAAPGTMILGLAPCPPGPCTTYLVGGESYAGTSFSAPLVTGLASLVWSVRPDMSPGEVKRLIVNGAVGSGPLVSVKNPERTTPGSVGTPFHVINAAKTIEMALAAGTGGCSDQDGDGYGGRLPDGAASTGCALSGVDCDDSDDTVHPGATEVCNGVDDNCNGHTDEEGVCSICADGDGDGASNGACGGTDCNDGDPAIHPGAAELCNGRDDDCNGLTDDASGAVVAADTANCGACGRACSPNQVCSEGGCMCPTDCAPGDEKCVGNDVSRCSESDVAGCSAWLPATVCPFGLCSDDACVDTCGDGTCDSWEDQNTCCADCGCIDAGEQCVDGHCMCVPDCDGRSCGGDGCGDTCGTCTYGSYCSQGNCKTCAQTCTVGQATCSGSNMRQVCVADSDGCPHWVTNSCAHGCVGGACISDCPMELVSCGGNPFTYKCDGACVYRCSCYYGDCDMMVWKRVINCATGGAGCTCTIYQGTLGTCVYSGTSDQFCEGTHYNDW